MRETYDETANPQVEVRGCPSQRPRLQLGADGFDDVFGFRKLSRLLLGVNLPALHADFKNAARAGDERERPDVGLELLEQSCRQTDGFRLIVSLVAILDFYSH